MTNRREISGRRISGHRISGRWLRGVAAIATVAGLVAVGAPTYADTHTARDARHDVQRQPASENSEPVLAPGRREGDVLSFRVRHQADRVLLRIRYDRLTRPRHRQQVVHVVSLRTWGTGLSTASLIATKDNPQGSLLWEGRRPHRTCEGLRTRIDYRADQVVFSVPRECLGNPRWVRAGGGTGTLARHTLWFDDAQLDAGFGEEVTLGPRVYR